MSLDLRSRETKARELMDDPACDVAALTRTYARFQVVNRLVSGWRRSYLRLVRPLLSDARTTTLLDVGSGGGDLPRALARWARRDGLLLEVLGIDPDPRAHAYAVAQPATAGVGFARATTTDLLAAGERFDVVISNHLLHHLDGPTLRQLLSESEQLATRLVVHSDLLRSRVAYLGWAVASWPAGHDSFLFTDGLLSIRRSYRPAELVAAAPAGWSVQRQAPFRLLLTHPGTGAGHG